MIKMTAGVYGLYDGDKVTPMTADDGPFTLSPEQERVLVEEKKVAVYVDAPPAGPEVDPAPPADDAHLEYSEDMKASELREVAKEMGLTFPVGTTKKQMLEAMDAHNDAADAETFDDGDAPPAFDATEAVQ